MENFLKKFLKKEKNTVAPQPKEETLGDRLAKTKQPFPWDLLTEEEKIAVNNEIRGVASVTAGGAIISPWQCNLSLSEERIQELADKV